MKRSVWLVNNYLRGFCHEEDNGIIVSTVLDSRITSGL
jgi:hypothetical protein